MLELRDVSVRLGGKQVLSACSLRLAPGERIALMGPSGCGKTTVLRICLSLLAPDAGSVRNDALRPAAVFQEPRLLPWRTAAENVNAVLSDSPETMPEALHWLELLGLREAAGLYPGELSGGMSQRVSIARALAYGPDLLILDEPFKGLDEALHRRVTELVSASSKSAALLLATHSEEEALALGCRILRYRDGRFESAST